MDSSYQSILSSPQLAAKRRSVREIFVEHPQAKETRDMLRLSLGSARDDGENASAYVIGWSRCGKSEIVKRLLREQTGKKISKAKVQLLSGNGKRFIYADLTGGATPRTLARLINDKIFNDRSSLRLGEDEGVGALIENVNDNGIDGVFLDEAQNMADDRKGIVKLGRLILSFENQCNAPLCVIGAPALENMRDEVDATQQRSGGFKKLEPLGFNTEEHEAFVGTFSDRLPYLRNWFTENEDDPRTMRATFYAQRGRPGRHALLVDAATVHAFIRTGGTEPEELTKADIAAGFDRVFRNEKIMLGLNPFRDENYDRLPEAVFTTRHDTDLSS